MMRTAILQHVPFESPGLIRDWCEARGTVEMYPLYERAVPSPDDFDWLIIMGGPMGANDEREFPFLRDEKELIARAAERAKTIVGICLGAQLIAAAFGASVFRNQEKEIGWMPVEWIPDPLTHDFPSSSHVLHWHGDTFNLPPGARRLARSRWCENQAFAVGSNVLALQFHLEAKPNNVNEMLLHCAADLTPGPAVHSEEEIRGGLAHTGECANILNALFSRLS